LQDVKYHELISSMTMILGSCEIEGYKNHHGFLSILSLVLNNLQIFVAIIKLY